MNIQKIERAEKKELRLLKQKEINSRFIDISNYDIPMLGKADTKFVSSPKEDLRESYEVLTAKYGNLQLLGYCGYYIENRSENGIPKIGKRTAVLGLCDCGRYTIGRLKDVKSGKKTSCGCNANNMINLIKSSDISLSKEQEKDLLNNIKSQKEKVLFSPERIKSFKVSILKSKYQKYITDSKKRRKGHGIGFDLSFEQFEENVLKDCYYCGQGSEESPTYNGLDRINNDIHYTYNNVVSCCPDCNRMKFTKTTEEFYAKIARIQNLKGNN